MPTTHVCTSSGCYFIHECSVCKKNPHTQLCDHPVFNGTCDAKLCKTCAVRVGNLDYCPRHTPK